MARLIAADEASAYETLRNEYFVVRKGWVDADPSHPGRETDRYDSSCHHLGVFQGPHLIAYLRALPWQPIPGFMLEHEFRDLLSEDAAQGLRQKGVVEISRLIVAPPAGSGRKETVALAELLFKLVYGLGTQLGWTAYYIVLEEAWLRVLNHRFHLPFVPMGAPRVYPDGTRTLAAFARCEALEQSMLETSPDKYRWYHQDVTK